jgi:uncharacterized protein (DUF427 family)
MSDTSSWLQAARDAWQWRGSNRPDFAELPAPGQVSVWDFPRPPRLVPDSREVVVMWGNLEVAHTKRAIMALETAHPPTFYLPWEDVDQNLFQLAGGGSFCEWKGPAKYWSLVDGAHSLVKVAWSYPSPLPGAELIKDCVALYANSLQCNVGGQPVSPQPGGFYGGWITPELVGPFKGVPGSSGW